MSRLQPVASNPPHTSTLPISTTQMPAVLVANHGPFTWSHTAATSVTNAIVLEEVARMARGTMQINPRQEPISQDLLDKHYLRKHGDNAYYGQD